MQLVQRDNKVFNGPRRVRRQAGNSYGKDNVYRGSGSPSARLFPTEDGGVYYTSSAAWIWNGTEWASLI